MKQLFHCYFIVISYIFIHFHTFSCIFMHFHTFSYCCCNCYKSGMILHIVYHRMPGCGSQRLNRTAVISKNRAPSPRAALALDVERANAAMEWRHIYSIASAVVVLLAVVLMSLCSLGQIPSSTRVWYCIHKSEGQIEVYTGVCPHSKIRIVYL